MPSTTSRGNYYKRRTRDWFEKQGYTVQLTEFMTTRPIAPGKFIYVKKDVFGADGIAMNGKEIIFWNSKHATTTKQSKARIVNYGKHDFRKFPFPPCVKRQLIMWEPRKQPVVIDCKD